MSKYYDEYCIDCADCRHCEEGMYQNITRYHACRYYGYILHPWKGVSPEHCPHYARNEEERAAAVAPKPRSMREMEKIGKKQR